MKLHTNIGILKLDSILHRLKQEGTIAPGVDLLLLNAGKSRTHTLRYDLSLGLRVKDATHRRARNLMGTGDDGYRYAATYDDWGWFISGVFDADPKARFAGAYNGREDFDTRTWQAFTTVQGKDPFPYAPYDTHPQHRRYTVEDFLQYAWLNLKLDDRSTAVAA